MFHRESPVNSGDMVDCIVEFDYEAEQPDELTIKTGQIIKNVMTEDGGWWEGELDGKKGMFPDNFVKIIEKTPKDKPHATVEKNDDTKKDLKTAQRSSVKDLASRIKDRIPVGGSQKKKESHQSVIKRAKVLFSYEPENEDELKLDVDSVVEVFKQEEEGWWEGSLNGKTGVFPSNFVQVVEELEPSVKTEHIPEEKPKESPQTEPKTKKIIGGVGLGNIFEDGPIKLRSTGSKKQPVEPEAKADEPPSHPAPSVNIVKREKQERAFVRHSYDPDNEDELTLKVGEIVNIISKDAEDPGWWKGELNGKVGVFPDNFVEIMHTDEPRPKRPPPPAATVKLPEKTATVEPVHTEKHVKKKDDLPSVEKSVPPKRPLGGQPPKLLPKPEIQQHKPPASTTKEEPPKEMSQSLTEEKKSAGHFDDIQTSTDKLTHLAASRPKGPTKRPPSQVFNHTPQGPPKLIKLRAINVYSISEEERNGDVKETHWAKDDETVHSKRVSPPPSKEETPKPGPSHPPARPPEPTATIPTAAITRLHSDIEELKKEMLYLKTSTVSKATFDELKQENEKLRQEVDTLKATSNRKFRDIINEVDDEKKIRLSTQVEIERIKKLVNESHV